MFWFASFDIQNIRYETSSSEVKLILWIENQQQLIKVLITTYPIRMEAENCYLGCYRHFSNYLYLAIMAPADSSIVLSDIQNP